MTFEVQRRYRMWKLYRRGGLTEMRPYEMGEDLDKVSVQPNYTPMMGDMIARRHGGKKDDLWLVAADYFKENYELIVQGED